MAARVCSAAISVEELSSAACAENRGRTELPTPPPRLLLLGLLQQQQQQDDSFSSTRVNERTNERTATAPAAAAAKQEVDGLGRKKKRRRARANTSEDLGGTMTKSLTGPLVRHPSSGEWARRPDPARAWAECQLVFCFDRRKTTGAVKRFASVR